MVGSVQALIYDFIVYNTWDCWKDKSNVSVLKAAGPSLYSSSLTGTMTLSALYHCQKKKNLYLFIVWVGYAWAMLEMVTKFDKWFIGPKIYKYIFFKLGK